MWTSLEGTLFFLPQSSINYESYAYGTLAYQNSIFLIEIFWSNEGYIYHTFTIVLESHFTLPWT